MSNHTEENIIALCKKHEPLGQQMLHDSYKNWLMGVSMRYIKSIDEAEDVLQESFLEIFKSIKKFKGQGSFRGWLRRIVVTTAIDHIRKQKKHQLFVYKHIEELDQTEEDLNEADYLRILDLPNYEQILLNTLSKINKDYSVVFSLFYLDDFSHKEISSLLKIDETTSRTRLRRARGKIKEQLEAILKNPKQIKLCKKIT